MGTWLAGIFSQVMATSCSMVRPVMLSDFTLRATGVSVSPMRIRCAMGLLSASSRVMVM